MRRHRRLDQTSNATSAGGSDSGTADVDDASSDLAEKGGVLIDFLLTYENSTDAA